MATARGSTCCARRARHEAELILFCIDGDQLDADLIEGVHEAFPQGGDLRARL